MERTDTRRKRERGVRERKKREWEEEIYLNYSTL